VVQKINIQDDELMFAQRKLIHWVLLITLAAFIWLLATSVINSQPATPLSRIHNSAPQDAATDLSKEPLVNLLGLLVNQDPQRRQAAHQELTRRGDPRAVPGLIELLRIPRYARIGEVELLLRKLTGKNFGQNWVAWSEWLAEQEAVELPPQFPEWKAVLFRLIDPAFSKFLYPGVPLRIRIEEIVWGGVKKDGIPALTRPKLVKADEATYLRAQDQVFGVALGGEARAYPLRIMDWHEMLNDVVGGRPVSLAYCTLCRSGILFDTTIEGRTFTFGSSGLLYRSNKLMYDQQTESLWMTLPGEPVSGALASSGIKLKKLPVVVTTWQDWRGKHPETLVLSLETGYQRDYRPGAAYGDYFASPDLMFPAPRRDRRLKPKEEVFTLLVGDQPKAYVLRKLRQVGVLNDTLGGEHLVLITDGAGAVRAYLRGKHVFQARKNAGEVVDTANGGVWSVAEDALINQVTGERLARLGGHHAYWFGWSIFYPQTQLYEGREEKERSP
jgi:hypothetical protein